MPPRPTKPARPGATQRVPSHTPAVTEDVDPIWLLKALGVSLLAALFCAWLAVCLLYYQGEWQLVLHPSRPLGQTPAAAGLPFESVHFDVAETGQARLTGWWLPADTGAKLRDYTVLYLHDGTGSLSATLPALTRLHHAGINIFAIDYRGFGDSDASTHPTEALMAEDTSHAFEYLTNTRHLSPDHILPYGVGLGASLAASLALQHPQIGPILLENPDPDPTATALAQRPSHLIPVRLLFREHFDLRAPLANLSRPKLLIAGGPLSGNQQNRLPAITAIFQGAPSPRYLVVLPLENFDAAYQDALARFFGQNLAEQPPTLAQQPPG